MLNRQLKVEQNENYFLALNLNHTSTLWDCNLGLMVLESSASSKSLVCVSSISWVITRSSSIVKSREDMKVCDGHETTGKCHSSVDMTFTSR